MTKQLQNNSIVEQRREQSVAQAYKKRGYRVLVRPPLPFGNSSIRPDLIALSEDDKVVIEVVASPDLQDNKKLTQLAALVENEPGWRLELVVTESVEEPQASLDLQAINQTLRDATRLRTEYPRAALMLVWSALEVLLRQRLEPIGGKARNPSPLTLVKTLYSQGILSQSAFDTLLRSAKLRNYVAHGYVTESDTMLYRVISDSISVGRDLLDQGKRDTQSTVDDLIEWFLANYEDPVHNVAYDDGYVYLFGGPYDAWDELFSQFPDVDEEIIDEAAKQLTSVSFEWVKRGQY